MSVFWSLCTYQLVCLSVCLKPVHSSYTCMSVCMCWPVCTYQLVCRSLYPTSSLFLMHLYVSVLASLCAPIRLCVCVSRLIHVYVCVVVSLYVSIGLSFCLSLLHCIPHARVCLCVGHSVLITWSVCMSVSSLGPVSCTCMSVCWLLCTFQLVCLSVCLSVCHTSAAFFTHVYVCAVASLYTPIRHNSEGTRNYTEMGDERLLETDYDRAVYDVTSPYQRVCIMQSRQFGHVLTLDDDVSKSPVPVFWGRFLWRVCPL